MLLRSISAIMAEDSGRDARSLVGHVPSVLQPASASDATTVAEVRRERMSGLRVKRDTPQPIGFPGGFPQSSMDRYPRRTGAARARPEKQRAD
jgi:hypothetical protein